MIRREQLPYERGGGSRKALPGWGEGLSPPSLGRGAGLFVTTNSSTVNPRLMRDKRRRALGWITGRYGGVCSCLLLPGKGRRGMQRACASFRWPGVSASDIKFCTVLAPARVQGAALAFDATLVAEVAWRVSAAVKKHGSRRPYMLWSCGADGGDGDSASAAGESVDERRRMVR